jgi:hypothetical protein
VNSTEQWSPLKGYQEILSLAEVSLAMHVLSDWMQIYLAVMAIIRSWGVQILKH